ncbi:MAG: GNAT family N-acetyltransferase [Alphaproteobacteria bacterium]|nr:GNAT family N-acetyltransferase [Alphaproteobacteria bacterium]
MAEPPRLHLLRRPPVALCDRLDARLAEFNRRIVGPSDSRRFAAVLTHPRSGAEIAGLFASSYWGWMYIDQLWVSGRYRRRGHGTVLMDAAEAEARRRRCRGLWLDTWSWQARGFYEKRGFRLFGTLDDFPLPHHRDFLLKRLDGGG